MRKILSLYIKLILIASMVLGSFSPVVFAAGDEITLSKDLLNTTGNTTKGGDVGGFSSNTDYITEGSLFGEKVIFLDAFLGDNNALDNTNSRLQIKTTREKQTQNGKVTFSYKLYLAAKSDGTLYFRARNSSSNYALEANLNEFNLLPYNWYDISIKIDLEQDENNCLITVNSDGTELGNKTYSPSRAIDYLGLLFIWGSPRTGEMPTEGKPANLPKNTPFYAIKDIKINHEYDTQKTSILSVGSEGVAEHGKNTLSFKLSKDFGTNLKADHVKIKKSGSPDITATSLSEAQYDGEGYVIAATLSEKLGTLTNYTLEISSDAYGGYKEISNIDLNITSDFTTSADPFSIRVNGTSYDVGNSLFSANVTRFNTTGTKKDICFVLASYDLDTHQIKAINKMAYEQFETNLAGSDGEISVSADEGDYIRFFVIDNTTNKRALFGEGSTTDFYGTSVDVSVSSAGTNNDIGTIKLGEFDYDKKKISVDVKPITGDPANGILTVYSDASNPEFIDYITIESDASYKREILFPDNFSPDTYIVEFIPEDEMASSFTNTFVYHSDDYIKDFTRDQILSDANYARDSGTLMLSVLGIDSNEEKLYNKFGVNNFDVFKSDANSSFYDLVENKAAVFELMWNNKPQSFTYDNLKSLFNSCAKSQYDNEHKEQTTPENPSDNNTNYGSTNKLVTENIGPSSSSSSSGGAGGTSSQMPNLPQVSFSDISGHWAEKFSRELIKKGIINGYADGTFRPENNITRAELAKLLSEAFGNETGAKAEFTDVAPDSWYYKYIANALNQGIVTGYEDGSFRPDEFVARQDAVLMLYRAMLIKKALPEGYKIFKDDLNISSYAQAATRCLGELGIITGNELMEFKPLNSITRAEVAAIICRGLDYLQSH